MVNQFADNLKKMSDELIQLKSAVQKSASSIELAQHSIELNVSTSSSSAEVDVKITPVHQDEMIWSATLNKLDGDDGGQTFEVDEFFDGGVYYTRVFFGNINTGSASATLTVISTDDFIMERVNG